MMISVSIAWSNRHDRSEEPNSLTDLETAKVFRESRARTVGVESGWLIEASRGIRRMSNFRMSDREIGFLFPPPVDEWLRKNHLARFIVDVVDGMNLESKSGHVVD